MATHSLPPLNWLRAFEASARHLSFTGAAQELNMTQSAVSQQIKALENHLGHALFVRRTRALQITDSGLNYLPTVQQAFATLSAGTRELVGGDRGRALTIQSNLAFAAFWLAPRLHRLLALAPWLSINVLPTLWDRERTAADANVEIRFGVDLDEDRLVRLGEDTCYPVCAPAFAADGVDWRHADLFDCSGMLANWDTWLGDQGESLPEGKMVNYASTYTITLAAAQSGAGLAMAYDTIASDLLARGLLARPYDHAVAMREGYYLKKPNTAAETPASRAFTDWLMEEFSDRH
jgi:LysR family glycine cleavage system transcriptional activator